MASYISQTEAAIYADSFQTMAMPKALALLSTASSMVDAYCNRTFTTDQLDDPVKCAVAMLAEWLGSANPAAGLVTSEKIGDYSVDYATQSVDGMPLAIQMLLAPYRIMVVG